VLEEVKLAECRVCIARPAAACAVAAAAAPAAAAAACKPVDCDRCSPTSARPSCSLSAAY
jgi:hypothetical protein